ncbi:hypothetical protein BH23BAC1_BH23BAC1_45910 [soil metagenome]
MVQTLIVRPMGILKDYKKFAALNPANLFENAPPLCEDISVHKVEK